MRNCFLPLLLLICCKYFVIFAKKFEPAKSPRIDNLHVVPHTHLPTLTAFPTSSPISVPTITSSPTLDPTPVPSPRSSPRPTPRPTPRSTPRPTPLPNKIGDPLVFPPTVESRNGILDVYLTIEYANYSSAVISVTNGRFLNGTHPGPTFILSPGDLLRIDFHNKLSFQPDAVQGGFINGFKKPDTSNLHWHGLHLPGELPSDDIRLHVEPGKRFQYEARIPDTQMPGTHWQHAHSHGSTALQVSSGNSAVIIVKDPPGYLPSQIADAEEVILHVHYWLTTFSRNIAEDCRDEKLKFGPGTELTKSSFRTVNGQYQPKLELKQNQWQRWRIVFSAWLRTPLDMAFDACDMFLLAKDGVYINDYPRRIFQAPITTAGRADIMVRCTEVGVFEVTDFGTVLMTVEVSSSNIQATNLQPWKPEFPPYLTDLRSTEVEENCKCETRLSGGNSINGIRYNPYVYQHVSYFGAILERTLVGLGNHPFHMHVIPFQIIGARLPDGGVRPDLDNGINDFQLDYYRVGDWHDVLMIEGIDEDVVTRFPVDVYEGRIFIHCHRLQHEDNGMMAQELVVLDGECSCDILLNKTNNFIEIPPELTEKELEAILSGP